MAVIIKSNKLILINKDSSARGAGIMLENLYYWRLRCFYTFSWCWMTRASLLFLSFYILPDELLSTWLYLGDRILVTILSHPFITWCLTRISLTKSNLISQISSYFTSTRIISCLITWILPGLDNGLFPVIMKMSLFL